MSTNWFVNDPNYWGYKEFETQQEAINFATERIDDYFDRPTGEWDEDVEEIIVGKVTHRVKMIDKRKDPDGRFDYLCDYELQGIEKEEKLKKMESSEILFSAIRQCSIGITIMMASFMLLIVMRLLK